MAQQFDSAAIMNNGDLPAVDDDDTNADEISDVDSAIGDVRRPSTTETVASEWFDHIERYGRTYHKYAEGKYLLPNDEYEQERLDLQNQLWNITLDGRQYLAPIEPAGRVLDIGTGTGIWAIEFGYAYPAAYVVGVDLSPIQPLYCPSNIQFEIDDLEDQWTFSQNFDFVHGRMLFTCFNKPANVIKMAYEKLNPGGYLELQDIVLPFESTDRTLDGTYLQKWVEDLIDCARKQGRDWTCAQNYKKYMIEAGFVDVTEKRFNWPINQWPRDRKEKEKGLWCRENLLDGLQGFSLSVLTRAGWSWEEVQTTLVNVRRDIKNRGIHANIPIVVVYGRKPGKI